MPDLYSRRAHPQLAIPSPSAKELLHLSVTSQLKGAAVAALNAAVWLREEMEIADWKDTCQLQYSSRLVAENKAKLLRDFHLQKYDGVERPADDVVYKELL